MLLYLEYLITEEREDLYLTYAASSVSRKEAERRVSRQAGGRGLCGRFLQACAVDWCHNHSDLVPLKQSNSFVYSTVKDRCIYSISVPLSLYIIHMHCTVYKQYILKYWNHIFFNNISFYALLLISNFFTMIYLKFNSSFNSIQRV